MTEENKQKCINSRSASFFFFLSFWRGFGEYRHFEIKPLKVEQNTRSVQARIKFTVLSL